MSVGWLEILVLSAIGVVIVAVVVGLTMRLTSGKNALASPKTICANCGASLSKEFEFCPKCGMKKA